MKFYIHEDCGGKFSLTLMGMAKCSKCGHATDVVSLPDNDDLVWALVHREDDD